MPKRSRDIRHSGRRLPAVAVFARAPQRGRAKTRLVPVLGPQGAADFQAALLTDAIRKVETFPKIAVRWLFGTGGTLPARRLARGWKVTRQRGRDLGERLERAFRRLLAAHPAAVVIGTDSPLLEPRVVREGLSELRVSDAVLGPCPDGGFYLIGLRCLPRGLFRGVRWSSRFAFRDVLMNLSSHGLIASVLSPLADVDRPADLLALAQQFFFLPAARRLAPATWGFVKGRMPTA